jgi:hypothetical protein
MHAGEANRSDGYALRDEIANLRSQAMDRERTVAALTAIVDRQIALIERYEAVVSASSHLAGGAEPATNAALELTLVLLDQAVAGIERRARDAASLEAQLDRALQLLDRSLQNQERMAAERLQPDGRNPDMAAATSAAVEETLARYDRMLERSLEALETAYRTTQSTRQEAGERERLLKRTLDLLENTVEAGNGATHRRQGLFGRLFS